MLVWFEHWFTSCTPLTQAARGAQRLDRATEPEFCVAEMCEVLLGVDGTVHRHEVDIAPRPLQQVCEILNAAVPLRARSVSITPASSETRAVAQ